MKFADVFLLPNLITLSRFFLSLYLFYNYTIDDFTSYVLIFIYAVLIREFLVLIGSIYVLITGSKINVSKKGKFGTVALFVLLCLFVLNTAILVPFLEQLAIFTIIFYFYVAIEYLYNLIYKSG